MNDDRYRRAPRRCGVGKQALGELGRLPRDDSLELFTGTDAKPSTAASGQLERRCSAVRQDQLSTCQFDVMPLSGKSSDFTVVISVIEETVVVHRERESTR